MVYKQITLELTPEQQKKASNGKSFHMTAGQVASSKHKIYVHPANYDKLMKAKKKGCGCRMNIEHGEINHDLELMKGGSLWSWLSDTAWPWLKKNVLPAVADVAVPALSTAVGMPQLAGPAREAIKGLTGVGISGRRVAKGSQEAKARMAKLRAMKKNVSGGSFMLN